MRQENHHHTPDVQRFQVEQPWKPMECKKRRSAIPIDVGRPAFSDSREPGPPTLRILKTAAELEELRGPWSDWSAHPESDPDFFSIRLRYRPGVVRPHVMVVYRDGRPDCMLVGWIYEGPVTFKVGSVVLFQAEARILRVVGGGFLGSQSLGNAQFLVHEALAFLCRKEIDAVEFSQARVDSPLYDLAKCEPNVFCRESFTPIQTHRYLTLPATFDQYMQGRGKKSTQHFRRHQRRLARDFPGKIRFQSVSSENEVDDFARSAEEISRNTYQRALGVGFVNNSESLALLRAAARRGALRASVLWVDEQPIAFVSGVISGQILYATFTGYDRAFEKYGPGIQTMMHFIEELFKPGGNILRFDAGCGDTFYKRRLFDSSWEEGSVWIFAPSAKGLLLHLLRVVSTSLHYRAMRLLKKSPRLRKLKKAWHRHLVEVYERNS